jgi:hypothetical protein
MVPALKTLLRENHLHEYQVFATEYRRVTRELELPRSAEPPSKAAYYHWLSGQMKGLPQGYHCLVLEQMFSGWTVKQLFACGGTRRPRAAGSGLLDSIMPAVDLAHLAGLWCTGFIFEGAYHVDLTTITVANGQVTARNSPPAPRTEGQTIGYHNDIECKLSGRHLIGQWRNTSDNYYFGSIHLAVMPGETVMDGYYTAVLTDTQVTAERWRFVRVDPQSAIGIDLNAIVLGEPRRLYNALTAHAPYGPPIALAELTDNR